MMDALGPFFRSLYIGFLSLFVAGASPSADVMPVKLDPLASSPRVISPYIYGVGVYQNIVRNNQHSHIWSVSPPLVRYGGNTSSRYNCQTNCWNTGSDWQFTNQYYGPRHFLTDLIRINERNGARTAITLPLLGWVAKDGHSKGNPDQFSPEDTSVQVSQEDLEWLIRKVQSKIDGKRLYILGNEPMLWHQTHRDVHPEPTSYDDYLEKYLKVAMTVRRLDPDAVIVGPALWGWLAVHYSARDLTASGPKWLRPDRRSHRNQPFLKWFLTQVRKKERALGVSLIDVVDVHYYPQNDWPKTGPFDGNVRAERVQAPRSLWDPSWTDQSWLNRKLAFIPTLQKMIQSIKPGLQLSIGEYNFDAEYEFSSAIIQADLFGIFGTYGLYSAHYWTVPPPESAAFLAFRLYRNYDGQFAQFGSIAIGNSVGPGGEVSVYASMAQDYSKITVVVVNKSQSDAAQIALSVTDLMASLPAGADISQVTHYWISEQSEMAIKSQRLESLDSPVVVAPFSVSLVELKLKR